MNYDKALKIAIGGNRFSKHWNNNIIKWSDFIKKCQNPLKSPEIYDEYIKLPKSEQDNLKDVGGFVGGVLKNGRRKANEVESRSLITLDLDNLDAGDTTNIIKSAESLGCAYMIYSTRKHTSYRPRLRLVIPTSRDMSVDEYEPCIRKVASIIGIDKCDPTTFDICRLMYFPSICSDGEYVFKYADRAFCSVDGILELYEPSDWKDCRNWARVSTEKNLIIRETTKQQDPLTKDGIVGAFCNTYSIQEAMDEFLPNVYSYVDDERYTYLSGSTTGGAVVYEDKFLFSHHATDPCSGILVNAFDLVRLHKFGHLDDNAGDDTSEVKLPSYKAMCEFANRNKNVVEYLNKQRHERAKEVFNDVLDTETIEEKQKESDWYKDLTFGSDGKVQKTINNYKLILENDERLKGKIVIDEFSGVGLIMSSVPWDNNIEKPREWGETDDSGICWYVEEIYKSCSRDKLFDAINIVSSKNKINAVKDYLTSLKWDGVDRIKTLLHDYLGAEKNLYTEMVMRLSLCAAVARAIEGGVKYDYMPILTGGQGCGKSTFLNVLGKSWFSDSLTSFEGKDAAELLRGVWIIEVGELTAFNRQEANAIKQFLSKRDDIYRAAYGRRTQRHPRRCVFFGTSNEYEYLKDITGGRRFLPVDVNIYERTKSPWEDLEKEVDQIWAQAYELYLQGEPLYLSGEAEIMANAEQDLHRESSEKEGMIRDYLDKLIPNNWYTMSIGQRRQYLNGNLEVDEDNLMKREKTCVLEIYEECFGGDLRYIKPQDRKEIRECMSKMKGWIKEQKAIRIGSYGVVKGYIRKKSL